VSKREQAVAELIALACLLAGGVLVVLARWGIAGAGWFLLVSGALLMTLGNVTRKGGS
jgi:hypothetical protein